MILLRLDSAAVRDASLVGREAVCSQSCGPKGVVLAKPMPLLKCI